MYYVYVMIDPASGIPFYVGKGTKRKGVSMRWVRHIREARIWAGTQKVSNLMKIQTIKNILSAGQEPSCAVVFETSKESDALIEEKRLISLHGRIIDGTGCLTNLIEGGSGFHNYTEQMKAIRSLRNSGSNNPMYGKHHSIESKQKIGSSRKKYITDGHFTPTKHTEEHKQRLRDSNPGGKATAKQIYQIDGLTGEVIQIWPSARQAALSVGSRLGNITHCANTNKHQRVKSYFWRWVGDLDVQHGKLTNIIELVCHNNKPPNPYGRKGKPTN